MNIKIAVFHQFQYKYARSRQQNFFCLTLHENNFKNVNNKSNKYINIVNLIVRFIIRFFCKNVKGINDIKK